MRGRPDISKATLSSRLSNGEEYAYLEDLVSKNSIFVRSRELNVVESLHPDGRLDATYDYKAGKWTDRSGEEFVEWWSITLAQAYDRMRPLIETIVANRGGKAFMLGEKP